MVHVHILVLQWQLALSAHVCLYRQSVVGPVLLAHYISNSTAIITSTSTAIPIKSKLLVSLRPLRTPADFRCNTVLGNVGGHRFS
jgi:hypothetical protein